jgi:pimeloyl-ACP methyl ester carboxylesterase
MNVAFRGTNEEAKAGTLPNQILPGSGNFWEDRQAAALGRGDISAFGFVVDVSEMQRGVTRLAEKPTGFHQRVYTSKYTLGEGVSLSGVPGRHGDTMLPCEQYFNYLGKYQPYGVYVPETSAVKPGLQVVMHGCEANHASQINQPNMQRQFGEGLNRILVSPLGRGNYGFYSDISERDVLDVMADIEAAYDTDKDRTFISGYSMGGYGAMRLAALYPHRFAGLVSWVGFSGDITNLPLPINPLPDLLRQLGQASMIPNFANGTSIGAAENIIDYLGNLRHIPGAYIYGALDELVQVTTALAIERRLAANGVPYQFYLHPIAEHLTFILLDSWQKEATYTKDLVRVKDPVRVTYRTNLASAFPEYEIMHDTAYWVSGIRAQREGYSDVDLTVPGCGGSQSVLTSRPGIGPMPVPWVSTSNQITGSDTVPAQSSISGSLKNISELEIDADTTCLIGKTVTVDVKTDSPVTLRLSDGRSVVLSNTRSVLTF